MTYYVSSGTLNPIHTHSLLITCEMASFSFFAICRPTNRKRSEEKAVVIISLTSAMHYPEKIVQTHVYVYDKVIIKLQSVLEIQLSIKEK